MSMKKVVILAAAALTLASCAKTYELQETAQSQIGFSTWNDAMTKAAKTDFVANDEFDVFGYKWNNASDKATVFDGVDVKYDGTDWNYSPLRFWDNNYASYTFFAAYPKDQLATAPAQTGLFVSNELTYNGSNEVLLVAQKKDVENDDFGKEVQLKFKHVGSLVDIKVKKHSDIAATKVEVTSIALSGIKTTGAFTVNSYDGNNNPVGTWAPTTDDVNTPYINNNSVTAGEGTSNAGVLFSGLVLMPQPLGKDSGPMITISYTITTGTTGHEDTVAYTNNSFYFGQFDKTDPSPTEKDNTDPRIEAWAPGYHYTYYITINADATITFSANIDSWADATDDGHYYLIK